MILERIEVKLISLNLQNLETILKITIYGSGHQLKVQFRSCVQWDFKLTWNILCKPFCVSFFCILIILQQKSQGNLDSNVINKNEN